jgi:hypothetical protein
VKIVFVHFGNDIPDYLKENLKSCCKRFKQHEIILLRNSSRNSISYHNLDVKIIDFDSEYQEVQSILTHPKDFRDGFWASSINRLLALAKFAEETNEPLVHFESDIIVAEDFPFNRFKELKTGLAYPIVSDDRGIASTVYIRDKVAGKLLRETVISEVRQEPASTDMTVLRKVYDQNKDKVSVLPSTAEYVRSVSFSTPESIVGCWKSNLNIMGGVFDGADFGFYLLGTDPRNKRGLSSLRTSLPKHYVSIKDVNFKINVERNFVDQESNGEFIPIYTLHATCKSTKLFKSDATKLLYKRVQTQNNSPRTVFAIWAFKYNLNAALRRRIEFIRTNRIRRGYSGSN